MSAEGTAIADFRARQSRRQAQAYTRFFSPITREFVPALVRLLGPPDGVVLDLGCGDGSLTVALSGRAWDVLALDLSPDLATLARARTAAPVVVGDSLRLPLATGRVAAIATAFLLPHLKDLSVALREAHRVLRPGGRLVMVGWAPAAMSPLTGLAACLLRDRAGSAQRALLAEAERRTDAGYLRAEVAAVGFADIRVDNLTTVVRLPSISDWWAGLVGASCGFSELYQAQTRQMQQDTHEAFVEAAADFELAGGEVMVPAAAVLLSCRRPR
jgi:ubiquinone/menaquinone biosynthesis C-methylase UbiE